jgi:EmrB/QacA subfamily drug resistance transporter
VTAPAPAALSHRQIVTVFTGLMLGLLLAGLDHTIVATALPTIVGDLGGLGDLSWVVTSYLLATTIVTPLYGKLGDLFGRKRLFQVAIVVFLVGSAACGLAQSMTQLVAFRVLQGLGGGGLIVLAQAIIADIVSPRDRGRYQGYFGAVFGASSVLGPLIGGFFTDTLSWRWAFYVNLPVGVVALVVTGAVLPAGLPRRARPRIDVPGAVLLSATITGIILVTTWGGGRYEWSSPTIRTLVAGTALALVAFVAVERRSPEPVLPLRLFKEPVFAVASSVSLIIGAALFSTISFMPVFLQVVGGASATDSGLLLAPLMAGLLGSSIMSGRIISRTGRYRPYPIVGTAIGCVGLLLLGSMDSGTTTVTTGAYMALFGAGIGMVVQTLVLATQNAVPAGDLGVGTSAISFFRSVGGSIGVALLGALFNSRMSDAGLDVSDGISPEAIAALPPGPHAQYVDGFADALAGLFHLALPALVAAFALTWLLREIPLRSAPHQVVPPGGLPQG